RRAASPVAKSRATMIRDSGAFIKTLFPKDKITFPCLWFLRRASFLSAPYAFHRDSCIGRAQEAHRRCLPRRPTPALAWPVERQQTLAGRRRNSLPTQFAIVARLPPQQRQGHQQAENHPGDKSEQQPQTEG